MKTSTVLKLARCTRPVTRYKTPVLYRISKWMVAWLCPKGKPGDSQQYVVPFDGGLIHVDTSSSIEYHLLFRGCHESCVTDLILSHVRAGDTCLDIGANVGAHTLVMAKMVGPPGRVIALEPHPRICNRLRSNVELNQYQQVHVIEAALADQDGEAPFYGFSRDAFHQGISSLLPDDEATEEMTVSTISYDTLSAQTNLNSCDFIKIDVEGSEAIILKQLDGLIQRCRPTVIFEYRKPHWEKFGASLDEMVKKFREYGYDVKTIRRFKIAPLDRVAPDSCEILCEPAA